MNLHWYFVSELLCFVLTWFCMLFVVIRTSNLFLSIIRSACVVSVSDWWLAHSWLHAIYSAENYGKGGLDSIRARGCAFVWTSLHSLSFRGRRVFGSPTFFTSSLVTRTSLHSLCSRGRLGFCIVWTLFTSSLVRPYRLDALRRSVVAMDIVFREEGKMV